MSTASHLNSHNLRRRTLHTPFSYDRAGCAKILADRRSIQDERRTVPGVKVPKRVGGSKSNDDALGLLHEKMVIWSRYDTSLLTCACALACDRHHRGMEWSS